MNAEQITDWRGTPITVGQTIVYGAPFGSRSIQMVEGIVAGFTKAGRVNVEITRRAASSPWGNDKKIVHVGADRLTVVLELPETDLPLWGEAVDAKNVEQDERDRIRKSHNFLKPIRREDDPLRPWSYYYEYPPCTQCGCKEWQYGDDDRATRECVGNG